MSGEGGGIILGAGIIIGLGPVIIGGAIAVGAVAGMVAIGKGIAKGVEEKRKRDEIALNDCGRELDGLYNKIQKAVADQDRLDNEYYMAVQKQIEAVEKDMRNYAAHNVDFSKVDNKIKESREKIKKALGEDKEREFSRIKKETKKEIEKELAVLQESNKKKKELIDWSAKTKESAAMQKTFTSEVMRDARASVELLIKLANNSYSDSFKSEVEVLKDNYNRAKKAFDNEQYDVAIAMADNIVAKGAMLALEHAQNQIETDEIRIDAYAKLSGLLAEIECQRELKFVDKDTDEEVVEDLNDFCQGKIDEIIDQIKERIAFLESEEGKKADNYTLMKLVNECDDVLEPNAKLILKTAYDRVYAYYEKLHALQIIADYMEEENYLVDWSLPVGNDYSQDLVVHFTNTVSGNKIAIKLKSDSTVEDLKKMALDVYHFFGEDEMTEEEKARIREGINKALADAGYAGQIGCKGCVNAEASTKEMDSESEVEKMKAKKLFD